MKKLVLAVVNIAFLAGCKNEPTVPLSLNQLQNDSLNKIIEQRDNEINDMIATLNEIQEGFRLIADAENKVELIKDGEGSDKKAKIRENIKFIQTRMAENRDLIEKLRKKLRETTFKSEELQRSIESFVKQLEEKDTQLKQLRDELTAKDIHIAELDQTISNLNTNVEDLKTESTQKTQTINEQDKQLHTAWYAFGTKSELKAQNILEKGDVLKGNFNKNYFTKVDIRVDKEIKFYSKSAKLLTSHPAGSYSLTTDANKQYILRITDPQKFWQSSKYLVVLVK